MHVGNAHRSSRVVAWTTAQICNCLLLLLVLTNCSICLRFVSVGHGHSFLCPSVPAPSFLCLLYVFRGMYWLMQQFLIPAIRLFIYFTFLFFFFRLLSHLLLRPFVMRCNSLHFQIVFRFFFSSSECVSVFFSFFAFADLRREFSSNWHLNLLRDCLLALVSNHAAAPSTPCSPLTNTGGALILAVVSCFFLLLPRVTIFRANCTSFNICRVWSGLGCVYVNIRTSPFRMERQNGK